MFRPFFGHWFKALRGVPPNEANCPLMLVRLLVVALSLTDSASASRSYISGYFHNPRFDLRLGDAKIHWLHVVVVSRRLT